MSATVATGATRMRRRTPSRYTSALVRVRRKAATASSMRTISACAAGEASIAQPGSHCSHGQARSQAGSMPCSSIQPMSARVEGEPCAPMRSRLTWPSAHGKTIRRRTPREPTKGPLRRR